MSDDDEMSSFYQLPIEERKVNLDYISKWIESQKLTIANTELLYTRVFDKLYNFCENQKLKGPEFRETKQIMKTLYTKAQRINMKLKEKSQSRRRYFETQNEIEDIEVEKNREILQEVKGKLAILNKLNIPLPFIINFVRLPKICEKFKLIIVVNDSLLDCINWYLINIDEKIVPDDATQFKMKELFAEQLEIISKQRSKLKKELSEVFLRLQKQYWFCQLETLSQATDVNQYLQISSKILYSLAQFCEGVDPMIGHGSQQSCWNGIRYFTKILLSICWNVQVPLPDILMHTKLAGRCEKLKADADHSTVIRLRKRITFLRQIYKIPQVYQICQKHKLIPIEINQMIPQYLQEQYNRHMTQKRLEISPNDKDYFIESQLRLLIRDFNIYKQRIREIFRDLRFQQGKKEIFELYQNWVNKYDGNLERIKCIPSRKQQKDIAIVYMMRHLEILVDSEQIKLEQPIKFEYIANGKMFEFLSPNYERLTAVSKVHFIKLFLLDIISLEQPFPYFLDFFSYEAGKFQQGNYNTPILGKFFYCPQVRAHFYEKYGQNILFVEDENVVTFTYIPRLNLEYSKQIITVSWDDIFTEHLKLLVAFKNFLVEEILYVVKNTKFMALKQQISHDKQFNKESFSLMSEIEEFSKQKENELNKKL